MKTIMKELTSVEEFDTLYNAPTTTIFTFSATWCPDCHFIKPFMPTLMEKYSDYQFVYVDTQKYPEIAKDNKIMGIPSFIATRDGKELSRFVSKLRKTQAEIDAFLSDLA